MNTFLNNMEIEYDEKFINSFTEIFDFIALDSLNRSNNFKIELKDKIESLVYMPKKFRKSIYFEDDSIRDLIFKGYVVPYKITKEKIIILGITKHKKGL